MPSVIRIVGSCVPQVVNADVLDAGRLSERTKLLPEVPTIGSLCSGHRAVGRDGKRCSCVPYEARALKVLTMDCGIGTCR
jgi:hypothetical protein